MSSPVQDRSQTQGSTGLPRASGGSQSLQERKPTDADRSQSLQEWTDADGSQSLQEWAAMDAQREPETAVVDGHGRRREPEPAGGDGHGCPTGARVCRRRRPRTPDGSQSLQEWRATDARREPESIRVDKREHPAGTRDDTSRRSRELARVNRQVHGAGGPRPGRAGQATKTTGPDQTKSDDGPYPDRARPDIRYKRGRTQAGPDQGTGGTKAGGLG